MTCSFQEKKRKKRSAENKRIKNQEKYGRERNNLCSNGWPQGSSLERETHSAAVRNSIYQPGDLKSLKCRAAVVDTENIRQTPRPESPKGSSTLYQPFISVLHVMSSKLYQPHPDRKMHYGNPNWHNTLVAFDATGDCPFLSGTGHGPTVQHTNTQGFSITPQTVHTAKSIFLCNQ